MKVISKIFLVALLLSLIFSCSAVFAEENMTFEQSSIQNVLIETDNQENNVIIGDEILKAEDYADSSSAMGDDNFQLDDDGALGVDDDVALNAGSSHNVQGNDFSSIQNAINSAGEGDTIYLNGKTYVGSGNQINVNKNNLIIVGGSQSNPDLLATLDDRKLSSIMAVYSKNVVITGIKFVNGVNERAGALRWGTEDGFLRNCIFEYNSATIQGGALRWDAKRGNMTNCNFTYNAAPDGGAVYWSQSDGFLDNCVFKNNNATSGGALFWMGRDGYLANSVFANNKADYAGGALYYRVYNLNLTECLFDNNSASLGGAVCLENSMGSSIEKNNFTNNGAEKSGSVIFIFIHIGCSELLSA